MPKQTLYFTHPADLSLRMNQLVIQKENESQAIVRPIEDISIIIIDHHSVHFTVPLLNKLSENNVAVIFCNSRHIPVSMLLDLDSNVLQTKYYRAQLEVSKPLKKQLWKQIVERKIKNQQNLLSKLEISDSILRPYYSNVRSGDSTNREAIASKVYWRLLFGKDFIRDRFGPHPNGLLNYGYSILRAFVSRAIMDSGLLPSIGIFHRNYYNSFTLADDLMEPYRPFIDEIVYSLYKENSTVTAKVKTMVVNLFYSAISFEDLSSTTRSLALALSKEGNYLYFPELK